MALSEMIACLKRKVGGMKDKRAFDRTKNTVVSDKMEHSDLVSEMAQVEHLTTQERLHLARRRRIQQLKVWAQREKEWLRGRNKKEKSTKRNIYFSDSVMLLEAAARNDIEEVRRLLGRGVTPDATNEDGLTALHQCCIDNNEAMMRLLLDHGADVNAEDSEKWTPLHAAATCGNLSLVRVLIQCGADLLAVNGDGNMPYDICEEERTLDAIEGEMAARGVTQRLIDETRAATELKMLTEVTEQARDGIDLDEPRDTQGATLLHIASANGYAKVVEFLLEHRASTDVVDHDMWQPVHAAACWGHLEVLELLVQYGADLNVRNKHDETPADICEEGEMRVRILRLAADQEESKRRAAARHSGGSDRLRGARRSSSTASSNRVRSVRRTSLREKQLAAKADARGEARLRETFDNSVGDDGQGFTNGVENDQNTANQLKSGDVPHKRSSNSSTMSNQSYDSQGGDYPPPKQSFSGHANGGHRGSHSSDVSADRSARGQQKPANPLFGVNAALHYAPDSAANIIAQSQHYIKAEHAEAQDGALQPKSKEFRINDNPMPNGVRKAPEGQDNDTYVEDDDVDGKNELLVNQEASSAAHYTTDSNGKINVHVTVMINAGTLADLKKQRSQIRTNGSPVDQSSVASTNNHSLSSLPDGAPPAPAQPSPLAPTAGAGAVPRFAGNTGDVVGDSRSRRCCVVM